MLVRYGMVDKGLHCRIKNRKLEENSRKATRSQRNAASEGGSAENLNTCIEIWDLDIFGVFVPWFFTIKITLFRFDWF